MKDYLGYEGKVCVVTGAASGVGKAITEALVDVGAVVYALDRNPVDVPGIKEFVKIDLGSKENIDDVFQNKLPHKFDQFFGIAGVSGETTPNKLTLKINFISNLHITNEYLPSRIPKGGAILFGTSVGANRWYHPVNKPELEKLVHAKTWEEAVEILDEIGIDDVPCGNAYTFSKRCLGYLSAIACCNFAEQGVRVNSLRIGNAKTGLMPEFRARWLRLNPGKTEEDYDIEYGLAGMAECYQMAEPALFLNSNMASYVSGEELIVDYGKDAAVLAGVRKDTWVGRKLKFDV